MSASSKRSAFTLVELMVAIALVLILMLGVSRVFSTASQTISANQGISDHTRDARAAQSVMADDFVHAVTADSPYMILHSEAVGAFRNPADLASDRDFDPTLAPTVEHSATREDRIRTIDIDGNNTEGEAIVPGEQIPRATVGNRQHRLDIFAFFQRGLFRRQTGGTQASNGATPFVAPMTSAEALVWYGHLRVANSSGRLTTFQDPGAGSFSHTNTGNGGNDNNYFASDWVLGRAQVLLREPTAGVILDSNNVPQIYIQGNGSTLAPLQYRSVDSNATTPNQIEDCRFDLAGTSISGFRQKVLTFIAAPSAPTTTWWSQLMASGGSRFQTNPIIQKPITPEKFSQQAPIFMRGCTQFIVEYAGDYLNQDNDPASPTYGAVIDTYMRKTAAVFPDPTNYNSTAQWVPGTTDGKIDYLLVGPVGNTRKQVRWYGFPRDVNGNGAITLGEGDVVPLRDVWQTSTFAATPQGAGFAPFEKSNIGNFLAKKLNYATVAGQIAADADYTCAWGPNDPKPKMIRITLVLDDPAARTAEGQTFEYVFELP